MNKLTPADSRKAIECFEEAIALEPEYAQAYAMSAGAYSYLGVTGQMLPDTAFEIVTRYADKALQIDNSIAHGHIAKGSAYLFYHWKWKEAFDELQKAIQSEYEEDQPEKDPGGGRCVARNGVHVVLPFVVG